MAAQNGGAAVSSRSIKMDGWGDDEMVVARTLSGDASSEKFSFLQDMDSSQVGQKRALREAGHAVASPHGGAAAPNAWARPGSNPAAAVAGGAAMPATGRQPSIGDMGTAGSWPTEGHQQSGGVTAELQASGPAMSLSRTTAVHSSSSANPLWNLFKASGNGSGGGGGTGYEKPEDTLAKA